MLKERVEQVFCLAYESLRKKSNSRLIVFENEPALQLHLALLLKSFADLLLYSRDEEFFIELEKPITHPKKIFGKSETSQANIDIYFGFRNVKTGERFSCAIELKYLKKINQREPNYRYDVFSDIHNLENYGAIADICFMVVLTDHNHYVNQLAYSPDTCDFDFREGTIYTSGKQMEYRTDKPYGKPITLSGSYSFKWDMVTDGIHFIKVLVKPT